MILHSLAWWQILLAAGVGFLASFIGNAAGSDGFVYLLGLGSCNFPLLKLMGSMKLFSLVNAGYTIIRSSKMKSLVAYKFKKFSFPIGIPLWLGMAYFGSVVAQKVSTDFMYVFLPIAALLMAVYKTIFFHPQKFITKRTSKKVFFYGILPVIFFYNGFFGPGGATFVILLAACTVGMQLKEGAIIGRHMSAMSNLISVPIFIFNGNIYFDLALLTIFTGLIGTKVSIWCVKKYGNSFINITLLLMLYTISIVYLYRYFTR